MSKLCFDFAYPTEKGDDTVAAGLKMMKRQNAPRGFTLIELLVVITVIAVLVSISLPVFSSVQEKARITQDLSNLRQIGIGTQTYLNDHDGILFTAGGNWMQELHPKYLPNWKIFQSPFDKRTASETDTTAPVSYGLNGYAEIPGLSTDKIQKPSLFILFAPVQTSNAQVTFSGLPGAAVTVLRDASTPGGTAPGGTQRKRSSINALFADLHSESLAWATFMAGATGPIDDPSRFRWEPGTP